MKIRFTFFPVFFCLFLVLCGIENLNAQKSAYSADTLINEIEIWPGVGPGSDSLDIVEAITYRALTGTCTIDRAIDKVMVPTITPFLPDSANGTAVILCPGGAYQRVVYDVEGTDIAEWYNSLGVTAFVLKYRLPNDPHINKHYVPLQDAQRAMRYVKMHADSFGIDSSKVGIMGCSAGGHLAASLATGYDKKVYDPIDAIDSVSAKPYFMVLLYPVVSMQSDITHIGSRDNLLGTSPTQEQIDEFSNELHVSPESPISFFAHCANDGGVSKANSERMHQALIDSGVTAELNIYDCNVHGIGICKAGGTDFANWVKDCAEWLDSLGLAKMPPVGQVQKEVDNYSFMVIPNPVESICKLQYKVSQSEKVNISAYDVSGRLVSTIVDKKQDPGYYTIEVAGNTLGEKGVYIFRLNDGKNIVERKVVFQ